MRKIIILSASIFLFTGCIEMAKGEKVGIITKMAQQGVFVKTWEGQLIRGGMNSGNGAFGAPFNFTVEKPSVIDKLRKALEQSIEVKIKYHQELFSFLRSESCNGTMRDEKNRVVNTDCHYFIDDVDFIRTIK